MKKVYYLTLILLLTGSLLAQERPRFEDYFEDATMRVDYYHTADAKTATFTLDQIYRQGTWAGSRKHLIEPYDLGKYHARIYDAASNRLIFTKGYNSFCEEYQTTAPAREGIKRTYHETVLIPFPKRPVLFTIEARDKQNLMHPVFVQQIDPADYHIIRETPARGDLIVKQMINGNSHKKVDLLFLGEGYTVNEKDKFRKDLKKFSDWVFEWEPYKRYKKAFNVYGILSPSVESGTDEPRANSYKNTALNTSFNTFDSPRYILTEDNKTLRDVAGQVPYDAILIMINHDRYGGGGIYNAYTTFTAGDDRSEFLLVHEMGHSFAGLADEYYTSDVSYEEFYKPGVEPLAHNLTALLDPENIKWKHLLSPGIDIPTDWQKSTFDSLTAAIGANNRELRAERERLQAAGASPVEIEALEKTYAERSAAITAEIDRFFLTHPLRGKIGAFEGGGYVSEGFYRPTVNSAMHRFLNEEKTFYPVNEEGIERIIRYYSE